MFKGNKNVIRVDREPDRVPDGYVPVYVGRGGKGQNFLVHKDSAPHFDAKGNVIVDGQRFNG